MTRRLFVLLLSVIAVGFLSPKIISSATDHIVISEVQISGDSAGHDFIELHNPTDTDFDLSGHRLVKRTATGTSDSSIKSWTSEEIIPAGGYYLWANSGWIPTVTPDASTSATIAANNGVALRSGATDTGEIVDSVAWGTATNIFVETTAFDTTDLESGMSMERVGDDTDVNSEDFVLRQTPDPQNSSIQPSSTPSPTPTPSPTETPTPTPEPTDTPEPSSTPEPPATPTPTPTETPEPTETPSPTPTPTSRTRHLAILGFSNHRRTCYLRYERIRIGFMRFSFPRIICERI